MKFFVDTAEVEDIRDLLTTGLLDGVTTNPSLIAKSGRDFEEVIAEICSLTETPVSAEVSALDAESMIAEGEHLAGIAHNVVVKLPADAGWLAGLCAFQAQRNPDECNPVLFPQPGIAGRQGGGNLCLSIHRQVGRYQSGRVGTHSRHPHYL